MRSPHRVGKRAGWPRRRCTEPPATGREEGGECHDSRETKREEGGGSHRREEGCDFFSICLSSLFLKLELLFPQSPIAIFKGKKKGFILEMLLGTAPSMFYLMFSPTSNPSTASTGRCPSSGSGTPSASEVASGHEA